MSQDKSQPVDPARARRNVILAWVHVLIAVGVLAAFVYVQSQK
jgi:hypothetical protein